MSAVFHYLGPAFAVLLFAAVEPLGVAWLRIASAAVVFAVWRRPWRRWARLDARSKRDLAGWGAVLAGVNSLLFAGYVVLAHRVARSRAVNGIDGLALAMIIASALALPVGIGHAATAFLDPLLLAAAVGVGVCSSVVPYLSDQLAMARLPRGTYALLVSLLPATATVIAAAVLLQVPGQLEVVGVALVTAGVATHKRPPASNDLEHP